jgi:osmotically-inducible protein OsmY
LVRAAAAERRREDRSTGIVLLLDRSYSSNEKEEWSMAQFAALLVLPARERTGEGTDAAPGTALPLRQSREELGLAERVGRALRATGYGPLRGIEVTVHARLVTLGGRVPSYYLKQVAQTTALAVPGARQVRNDLEVGRPHPCR